MQKDEMDKELILNNLQFRDGADWKQFKKTVNDMLLSIGVRSQFSIYAVNVSKRSCRVAFFSIREKAEAEGLLSVLRKKGKFGVRSKRPDVHPYIGDVRDSYKQMKVELYSYWRSVINLQNLGHLNVTKDVWMENIFID